MNNVSSVEVIELLYSLQQIELGDEPTSKKNQKTIAELREKLPANILGHYDRLMKRGKKGVSIVKGTNCPECHMTLPSGTRAQLMRAEDIVLCDTCARYLLFKPDEEAQPVAAPAKAKAKRTTKKKAEKAE